MRRAVSVALVLGGLAASGCGGVGSVPSARPGLVEEVLHSAAETTGDGSMFAGLVVTPGGTVYLGVVDGDYDDPENVRVLQLRRGREPRVFLSADELSVPGVETVEPRLMAQGRGGELLVAAPGDGGIKVLSVSPEGQVRVAAEKALDGRGGAYYLHYTALAADPRDGTIYLSERCRVYRAPPGGALEPFAGDPGTDECYGSGNSVLRQFRHIRGLAVDPRSGLLFIADAARVYRFDGTSVTPVAGRAGSDDHGRPGFSGDDGPALDARLDEPGPMAVDPATGDLYICDLENRRIRKVDGSGRITTAVGNGNFQRPYEGPSTDVAVDATQVGIDTAGNLWATADAALLSTDSLWSERVVTTRLARPAG